MVKRNKKYTQFTSRLISEETEADEYIERMKKKLNDGLQKEFQRQDKIK